VGWMKKRKKKKGRKIWGKEGGGGGGYVLGGGVGGGGGGACPIFILSNRIPTWPGLGLNLGACFERTATTA